MEYKCLEGLEPKAFFDWFGAVSQIPRGSGKEQGVIAFLQKFAKERGLEQETDAFGNILIRVPATVGLEEKASMLFQAHMDMVWRQKPGRGFDFETQPIPLKVVADRVVADGTTLGADNAVGMATMLALADGALAHPALELLFTVQEEVGLKGIRAFDMETLHSRQMINMDCGDSHVLCVCSAGSISGEVKKNYSQEKIPADWQGLKLTLSGGLGGHGGISANKGRACGGNLLGDLLLDLPVRLCRVHGEDAIIKTIEAVIAVPDSGMVQVLNQRFAELKTVYQNTDPGWVMKLDGTEAKLGLGTEDSRNVVLAMSTLRTGQFRNDGNLPGVILTSGQMRGISLKEGMLEISFGVRSACDADQHWLFLRYKQQMELLGLELKEVSRYSGWQEDPDSRLRERFQAAHQKLFGEPMQIERAHGGVEVGIVMGAIADMDAIGVAPTARGAHTTGEYLLIEEVVPYWRLLEAVLAD